MENDRGNRKWQPLEDRQIKYLDQHLLLAVQLLIESGTGKNSPLETCSWLTGKKIHFLLLNSSLGRACQETDVHWDPVGLVEWDQSQGPPDSEGRTPGTQGGWRRASGGGSSQKRGCGHCLCHPRAQLLTESRRAQGGSITQH